MVPGISIPSQWPRTFSVLGIGMGTIVVLNLTTSGKLFFYLSNLSQFSESTMPQPLVAFNFFALVFVSYVVGEFFCIVGTSLRKNSPIFLKRHAIVLFCSKDESGFWNTKLLEAERRYELFCGLSACSFILSMAYAGNLLIDGNPAASLVTVLLGLISTFFASSIARDSFGELDKTISNILELKQKNATD